MTLLSTVARLQRAQVSVQAMNRASSVGVFLLASWGGHSNLPLVALQGVLFSVPYVLQESMLGRVLARQAVPQDWDWTAWAARATLVLSVLVVPVLLIAPVLAVPGAGWKQWAMAGAPVLLQMPIEALYWLLNKRHSAVCGNLVQQATAAGTIVAAGTLVLLGQSVLLASLPAQLLTLLWAVRHLRGEAGPGRARPGILESVRPGASYGLVAAVNLVFSVALPTLAGAYVGAAAVVVIRALDLAFGPFHLLLSASVREDMMRGRQAPLTTPSKLLVIAALAGTSVLLISSPGVRHLLSADLASAGRLTIATYCVYKAFFAVNTWQGSRHMLRSTAKRFMTTGIVASSLAIAALSAGRLLALDLQSYLVLLCGSEMLLIAWFALRNSTDPRSTAERTESPHAGLGPHTERPTEARS